MMELMTKEIEEQLKEYPLMSQSEEKNPLCVLKFFYPYGRGTWYVMEAEKQEDDYLFFGFVESPVDPLFDELGYFTLNELKGIRSPFGGIERDLYYKPLHLNEIRGE